jgi:fructokinase
MNNPAASGGVLKSLDLFSPQEAGNGPSSAGGGFSPDNKVAAKPGGSMLNSAVSLGRAGINVGFISEVARDQPGEMIVRFLKENQVDTSFLNRQSSGKTTLALAFLNEKADARYEFYTDLPKESLTGKLPLPARDDVVLFGSFFSLADGIHEKLKPFLASARENNALILYDPNFRTSHLNDLPKMMPRILENISLADIVRASDEDFLNIFATREPMEAYDRIRTRDTQVLILTRSDKDVSIMTGKQMISVPVPGIVPVSTIGAGDAFNAGLIHAFIRMGIGKEQIPFLPAAGWEEIAGNAIRFAQNVCMRIDNYISHDLLTSPGK